MTPEETALFQQAQSTYNAGHHQQAYQQFCALHLANREDTSLLCWIGYSTPDPNEAQRALADVERLKPNHPSLPKLRDRVKKLPPRATHEQPPKQQPVIESNEATEEPTNQAVVTPPSIRHWRKVGDKQWQSIVVPLRSEGNHELFFVPSRLQNNFTCANCGKSLSEIWYLFYRTVPKTEPHERYCMEHSPIAFETQEGPGLFQRIATLEQHIADLEQRVAELEAQKGSDQDSQQESQ